MHVDQDIFVNDFLHISSVQRKSCLIAWGSSILQSSLWIFGEIQITEVL